MNRDKRYIKVQYPVLSLLIAMLFIGSLFTRCATVGTPTGGDKDTIPPIIVAMTPSGYSTNMDTMVRKIYIEFNEFVQLVDQQKEFFTSPRMNTAPQLSIRGRGVVITLRDTLKPNTTYALNFGSTVRDVNESNPLNSMRYVFSTGDEIDSMVVSGYTEDSYKADSASKTLLYFYPADSVQNIDEYDSTLFNMKPAVIARAENNGVFIAQNLKPIDYRVYAMIDDNYNTIYEPGTDKVGFLDSIINPANLGEFSIWYDRVRKYVVADPQLHIRVFMDLPFQRQLMLDSKRPDQNKVILYFNSDYPDIDSIRFDSIPMDKVVIESMSNGNDTLALWFDLPAEMLPDTIKGNIYYYKHDSVRAYTQVSERLRLPWKFYESKAQIKEREEMEKEREKAAEEGRVWVEPEKPNPFSMTVTISNEKVNPEKSIPVDFAVPIREIDSTLIQLTRMSAKEAEASREIEKANAADSTFDKSTIYRGVNHPFQMVQDTQNIRKWHIYPEWSEKEDDEYYLTIAKGAFTNIMDQSNDSLTAQFTVLKMADFATVIVNVVSSPDDESEYILELLNERSVVIERKEGVASGRVVFNYVPAGEVSLRVLQDRNKNGVWDTGDLVNRRQPEKSILFVEDNNPKIATKANWEVELKVETKTLFAPESPEELAKRLEKQESDRLATEAYDKELKKSKGLK